MIGMLFNVQVTVDSFSYVTVLFNVLIPYFATCGLYPTHDPYLLKPIPLCMGMGFDRYGHGSGKPQGSL